MDTTSNTNVSSTESSTQELMTLEDLTRFEQYGCFADSVNFSRNIQKLFATARAAHRFQEEVAMYKKLAGRTREEIETLRKFKQYVHDRFDKAGVPADPEPEKNAKHGCRIEGRINWVIQKIKDYKMLLAKRRHGELEIRMQLNDRHHSMVIPDDVLRRTVEYMPGFISTTVINMYSELQAAVSKDEDADMPAGVIGRGARR